MNQRQPSVYSVEGEPQSQRKIPETLSMVMEAGDTKMGSSHSAPPSFCLCYKCQPREYFRNISLGLCNFGKVQIFSLKELISS